MENIILKKENGEITTIKNTHKNRKELNNVHLCYLSCSAETFKECQKVFEQKKLISEYDYITDGYQVFDEKGNMKNFCVNKCKNCIKVYEGKVTERDKMIAKQKIEELMMTYFDALTVEEALRIQEDIEMRNKAIDRKMKKQKQLTKKKK